MATIAARTVSVLSALFEYFQGLCNYRRCFIRQLEGLEADVNFAWEYEQLMYEKAIEAGVPEEALELLKSDVLQKTNGKDEDRSLILKKLADDGRPGFDPGTRMLCGRCGLLRDDLNSSLCWCCRGERQPRLVYYLNGSNSRSTASIY